MRLTDFDFNLPDELIAQHPLVNRTASRLLCLNRQTGALQHHHFSDLIALLKPYDLLVFNDTKVLPARLLGQKASGGKVEILLERFLSDGTFLAHVAANHKIKDGMRIFFTPQNAGPIAEIVTRQEDLFILRVLHGSATELFQQFGLVPLPHYIRRMPDQNDLERYQTVYAKNLGAVAAPTAGLHFDAELLKKIAAKKIATAFVTLHVAAGTFKPVRVENITEHRMHHEFFTVSGDVCDKVRRAKEQGGRVIAVGTTSVRALESAALAGTLQPMVGDTDIFIYPSFTFKVVDALVTNFHLPKSTLLMLISAFASRENVLHAYQEAVRLGYRFFSYGDAMFIA